jgi:hypothetical protein
VTVVLAVAALLLGFASSSASTVATLVTGLAVDALVVTTSATVTTLPSGIVPKLHTRTLDCKRKLHDALLAGLSSNEPGVVPGGTDTVSSKS